MSGRTRVDWARLDDVLELARRGAQRLDADGLIGARDQMGAKWRDVLDELEVDVFDERDLYIFVAGVSALHKYQGRLADLGITNPRLVLEVALAGLTDYLPPA